MPGSQDFVVRTRPRVLLTASSPLLLAFIPNILQMFGVHVSLRFQPRDLERALPDPFCWALGAPFSPFSLVDRLRLLTGVWSGSQKLGF
jgi:hypothetical protein